MTLIDVIDAFIDRMLLVPGAWADTWETFDTLLVCIDKKALKR